MKEGIERNENKLVLSPNASPPGTDTSFKNRWSNNIKYCSPQRINWHLSCERCMRSANVSNTTEIQVPVGLRTHMWTVYEMAIYGRVLGISLPCPAWQATGRAPCEYACWRCGVAFLGGLGFRFCERARWRLVGGTRNDSSVVWEDHERMRCESGWWRWFSVSLRRSWESEFESIVSRTRSGSNLASEHRRSLHDGRVIAVWSSICTLNFSTKCHRWNAITLDFPLDVFSKSFQVLVTITKKLESKVQPVIGLRFNSSANEDVDPEALWLAFVNEVRQPVPSCAPAHEERVIAVWEEPSLHLEFLQRGCRRWIAVILDDFYRRGLKSFQEGV